MYFKTFRVILLLGAVWGRTALCACWDKGAVIRVIRLIQALEAFHIGREQQKRPLTPCPLGHITSFSPVTLLLS